MENIHPNQTTIYDFLPSDKCIYLDEDKDSFDFCTNIESDSESMIVYDDICKKCKCFKSVEK